MKRILGIMLCLLMLCPAALGEVFAVDSYGTDETMSYSMLVRDDGTALTPPRVYSNIYRITPEGTPDADVRYAVTPIDLGLEYDPETAEEMLYEMGYTRMALMDADGQLLTGFDYDGMDYDNGQVSFSLPGETPAVGGMDADGHVLIPPEYAALRHLGGGKWLGMAMPDDPARVERVDDGEGGYSEIIHYEIVFIDTDGSVRPLGLHSTDRYFNMNAEGICAIWDVDEYGGETVYIDADGALMFEKGFRYAENFEGNYAVVAVGDRYGVIDRQGEYVLPPEYDYINRDTEKLTIARKGMSFEVYDPESMRQIMTLEYAEDTDVDVTAVTPDLVGVVTDGATAIYNIDGRLLFDKPQGENVQLYGYPRDFQRLVADSGDWPEDYYHLIDLEGNAVGDDYRMLSVVGWQDGHGRFITGDYRVVKDEAGDYMVDWNTYRYGLIDEDGNTLLPTIYDELRALSFDRYWAVQGDISGMIDAEGKWYYTVSDYETLMD